MYTSILIVYKKWTERMQAVRFRKIEFNDLFVGEQLISIYNQ